MRHLQSYDTPVELPSIKIEQLLIKKPPINEFKKTVLNVLQFDFKRLVEFARLFNIDVQEISSLDSTYKEMLKILHDNKTRSLQREIRCSSIVSSNSCTGSTYVTIHVSKMCMGCKYSNVSSVLDELTHCSFFFSLVTISRSQ